MEDVSLLPIPVKHLAETATGVVCQSAGCAWEDHQELRYCVGLGWWMDGCDPWCDPECLLLLLSLTVSLLWLHCRMG